MTRLLVEPARPRAVREHPYAPWFAVGSVCVGAFMGQLDASIVTLAFPALQRDFSASLAAAQWVSLAYLLALVGLLAGAGRLADAVGRKLVYLYGFLVFTVASAACGLAPTLGALIGFRVLQAAGAAMLQANSVALVVTSVPRARMRAALGMQAAAQALGLALGPTVGGLLVGSAGWRWVFWVNVPVGCAALVVGRYLLPRTRERADAARFDWPGLLLIAAASTAALLAISGASGLGLSGAAIAALAVVAAAATAAFGVRERRAASPLVDIALLRTPAISAGLAGAMCGYLVLFGPLALVPQILAGRGATYAGLVLTTLPAGFALAALAADRLLPRRLGNRSRCVLGGSLSTVAAALLCLGVSGWSLFLLGLGLGLFIPANNAAVMAAVPRRLSATAGGMVNMTRGIGTALGIAVVTLFLHSTGEGARPAFAAMAAVAVVATATGLVARTPGEPRT
ncbi:MFS transporter [Actinoallomurus iriomotensis]|uniref:MFS transporter n=1 Tax=Actinoallomurus iriomotensis TaxID=478107 RepID=A0A9W6RBA3_9ACTN|nr:MFS transporter [Actinoallomurus iriomotensis]GLY72478.1 MFS transporter [Actinoallomurus iriomotensis]